MMATERALPDGCTRRKGPMPKPVRERFWPKVQRGTAEECWPWIAGKTDQGYGRFYLDPENPKAYAHRVAYELRVGPIEPGAEIDHTCRNRACVNPDHLRPAEHRENAQNLGINALNTSGVRGVYYCKTRKNWVAQVKVDGRRWTRRFSTKAEAAEAVRRKRLEVYTHNAEDRAA